MADSEKQPTEAQAEKRLKAAQAELEAAQAEVAEAQGELRAVVVRDVPRMVVRALPNVHIQHENKNYHGREYGIRLDSDGKPTKDRMLHGDDAGDELTLDGPTAIALVMDGKVEILRSEGVKP